MDLEAPSTSKAQGQRAQQMEQTDPCSQARDTGDESGEEHLHQALWTLQVIQKDLNFILDNRSHDCLGRSAVARRGGVRRKPKCLEKAKLVRIKKQRIYT